MAQPSLPFAHNIIDGVHIFPPFITQERMDQGEGVCHVLIISFIHCHINHAQPLSTKLTHFQRNHLQSAQTMCSS